MEQYISKDTLVTKIESRISDIKMSQRVGLIKKRDAEKKIALFKSILSLINTLEVKEVDLEEELNKWRHNHFHGRRDKNASGEYLERISQLDLSKYFFKLGIEKSVDDSLIRKIVDLNNEAAKHYDAIIKKEREENGFSQLAIDLLDHNVDVNELRIQYIIENLRAQKGE